MMRVLLSEVRVLKARGRGRLGDWNVFETKRRDGGRETRCKVDLLFHLF